MPLTGYQDWQRVEFASGEIVIGVHQAITATTDFTAINLSPWTYINVSFFAPAGADNYSFGFEWFTDSTFSVIASTNAITVNSDMNGFLCLPVQTPWMKLHVIPKAGGNATVVTITCYGAQQFSQAFAFDTFATPQLLDSSAYAINQTKQFFTFTLYGGNAMINILAPTAAAANCFIDYFDFGANAYKTYINLGKPALGVPLTLVFPQIWAQLRVNIVNAGTAQTITTSVTAVPG